MNTVKLIYVKNIAKLSNCFAKIGFVKIASRLSDHAASMLNKMGVEI
jgi:hypothetical protein